MTETTTAAEPVTLPAGEYAIVEIMGHDTLVGRVEEVERFGATLLQIEPIYRGELLPPIYQGGASIYRFSPCTAEQAFTRAPANVYQIPAALRAILPEHLKDQPQALPSPMSGDEDDDEGEGDEEDDDDLPF